MNNILKSNMQKPTKTYSVQVVIPSNFKELNPTKVRADAQRACTPRARDFDLKTQWSQRILVIGLVTLSVLINNTLQISFMIRIRLNPMFLFHSVNRKINLERRKIIKPDLRYNYKLLGSLKILIICISLETTSKIACLQLKIVLR